MTIKLADVLRTIDAPAARLVGALPWLLVLAVAAGGGWRAAGWAWRLIPDPTAAEARAAAADGQVQGAVARHWFGEAALPAAGGEAAPVAAKAPPPADVLLLGVIAGGRRPLAMLQVGKDRHEVVAGESFADGLVLREVGAEHAIVERQGRPFRVDLPSVPGQPGAAASSPDPTRGARALSQPTTRP